MRRSTFIFLCLFVLSSSVGMAQIKVDATGKVFFGKAPNTSNGFYFNDLASSSGGVSAFSITRKLGGDVVFGAYGAPSTGLLFSATTGAIAVGNNLSAANTGSYTGLQVCENGYGGGVHLKYANSAYYEGFRSQVDATTAIPFAAYRNNQSIFYVDGNGIAYSNGTPLTSDISLKSDIEIIPHSLDKVLQLRGVTFNLNFPNNDDKEIDFEEAFKRAQETTPGITLEIFKQIQEEKSRKRMGVIAQEVEQVIPELVRTRADGLKAVFYPEMVGLLIEAIKELQAEVEELKGNAASELRSSTTATETTGIANAVIAQCKLFQNVPNPFTGQTEIKYTVPAGVKSAFIYICDMQGKLVQKLDAKEGQNSVSLGGSKLHAGMYLYSLIVDGQEVDTKRMVLTK